MLKVQSSIMDFFMAYSTGIGVKHSKYGLISLEFYVIKSFDLIQLSNYLRNSIVEKKYSHVWDYYSSHMATHVMKFYWLKHKEGEKEVSHTHQNRMCQAVVVVCHFTADLRGPADLWKLQKPKKYIFTVMQSLWKKLGCQV